MYSEHMLKDSGHCLNPGVQKLKYFFFLEYWIHFIISHNQKIIEANKNVKIKVKKIY